MTQELLATLRSALAENDSHQNRIRKAAASLSARFPLTKDSMMALGDEVVSLLDQFIYRFTKMQDSLGTRFLPALHSFLEDEDRPFAFLDVLNRLEQLEVLGSVESWQFFRGLRNRLAHDYPETLEQTIETLNTLYSEIDGFLELYERARLVCISRLPKDIP